jgi:hypothetical protein
MSFQWLQMRISEEKDRRLRESQIQERLPRALEELHKEVSDCIENYVRSFGMQAADATLLGSKIRVVVREEREGKWQPRGKVEITAVPALPGFQIERENGPLVIEVGMLPGDRIFYRDQELDQYLNMEELTRRILDRTLFPKLRE